MRGRKYPPIDRRHPDTPHSHSRALSSAAPGSLPRSSRATHCGLVYLVTRRVGSPHRKLTERRAHSPTHHTHVRCTFTAACSCAVITSRLERESERDRGRSTYRRKEQPNLLRFFSSPPPRCPGRYRTEVAPRSGSESIVQSATARVSSQGEACRGTSGAWWVHTPRWRGR